MPPSSYIEPVPLDTGGITAFADEYKRFMTPFLPPRRPLDQQIEFRQKQLQPFLTKPRTKEEKNSLTPLHRLIFNLKKLIRMVPFGKTAFASYAVALALLKEQSNLDAEQTDQLFEDFYKLLKDTETFEPDMLSEATEVGKLCSRRTGNGEYYLRTRIKQNFDEAGEIKTYKEKQLVTDIKENSMGYGVLIYEGRIGEDRILFTAEDVY